MKAQGKARVALDVLMTAMIVFEMFIQYTGNFLHEVVGFAFFATVIAHMALSAKWMKGTAKAARKGSMTGRRTALAVVGVLLAVATTVLGISSIAISGLLADAGFTWTLGSYAMWATVHAVSSYALCALVVVHLAMHWAFLASAFKVPYNPARRQAIGTGVKAVAAVGAVALGITAVREALPYGVAEAIGEDAAGATAANSSASSNTAFNEGTVNDLSGSSSSSSASGSLGDKHGKGSMPQSSGETDGTGNAGGTGNVPNGSGSAGSIAPDAGSGSAGAQTPGTDVAQSSPSTVTGTCTLCRKQCPLSAPKCNKPYEAGLL